MSIKIEEWKRQQYRKLGVFTLWSSVGLFIAHAAAIVIIAMYKKDGFTILLLCVPMFIFGCAILHMRNWLRNNQ